MSFSLVPPYLPHTPHFSGSEVDAVRVVTGGADGLVRVMDVMTGRAVQTFQAHSPGTPVLLLQFDPRQLLTGGADGHLRRWLWSSSTGVGEEGGGAAGERVTKHFVGSGDSLRAISQKYGTTVKEIMAWNNLKSGRDIYGGMSLVVAKSNAALGGHPGSGEAENEALASSFALPSTAVSARAAETQLFHPTYGLKALEANLYKDRPPRKDANLGAKVEPKAKARSDKPGGIGEGGEAGIDDSGDEALKDGGE